MPAAASDQDLFKLFPSCKLVIGVKYSAIYDLQRRRLIRFSSSFVPFLEAASRGGVCLMEDGTDKGAEARRLADSLIAEGVASMWSYDPMHAQRPDAAAAPHRISNAIIDVDAIDHDWVTIREQLDGMDCQAVQIRCYSALMTLERTSNVLNVLAGSSVTRIELLIQWSGEFTPDSIRDLAILHKSLFTVRLYSSPSAERIDLDSGDLLQGRHAEFTTRPMTGPECCGTISLGSLNVPSSKLDAELRNFNGCLNRKVSVRSNGEICNCPSLKTGYGNDLGKLGEVVGSSAFQRIWSTKKDDIAVCRRCEFRYVCSDCRAYLGDDASLAKPAHCTYDPETGSW